MYPVAPLLLPLAIMPDESSPEELHPLDETLRPLDEEPCPHPSHGLTGGSSEDI